jgi:hypothetical protein
MTNLEQQVQQLIDARVEAGAEDGVQVAARRSRTGVSVAVTRNRFNPVEMQAVEQVGELVATAHDNGGSPR